MGNRVSALIVVYNEENVIERCLESIFDVVDEIILVHDGPCKDKTLEIASKYTNKIFEMPENKGMCEAHYIFGFSKCSFDWVLKMDADEYLSDDLKKNIKNLAQNDKIDLYNFVWPIWNGKEYITNGWPYKGFLFRKSKIGFLDKYHFPLSTVGTSSNADFVMEHKPLYNNYDPKIFKTKTIKWCKLQALDHFTKIESRENLNLNIENLQKDQKRKDLFYGMPFVSGFIAFLSTFLDVLRNPIIIFQKGFWIVCLFSFRYTYNVACEVNKLRKQGYKI